MGFLVDVGQTLNYHESKPFLEYVKQHGILQFLNLYKKFKDENKDKIYWGDEIEFHLINIDPQTKLPRIQTNSQYIFDAVHAEEFALQPEYGSWMVEAVPTLPYDFSGDPTVVLENMKARFTKINAACKDGDALFAGTVFPLLGVGDYYIPKNKDKIEGEEEEEEEKDSFYDEVNPFSRSQFVHDEIINSHPRFGTMTENIRLRRGEKVKILTPIYKDEKTCTEAIKDEPYPGFVYMDCQAYGMGGCCLQLTYGTKNIQQARYLTDQLAVFSSIMLPLSAATSVMKGKIVDVDVRWNSIARSVDCRTAEERDPQNPKYISKSRYQSISLYISDSPLNKPEYNDLKLPLNQEIMKYTAEQAKALDIEVDEKLLNHIGFLYMRDPMVIFSDKIYVDDASVNNHFENIQSTNWNSIRFKPPPSFTSSVGWRVELRTPDAQLTADESTAYTMFAYFVADMIMKREYNFYIPISKVDENFERGHKKDAILQQKFWFRKNLEKNSADEWVELTIDEILHGKEYGFVGLLNLIYSFIKEEYGVDVNEEIKKGKEDPNYKVHRLAENVRLFDILSKRAKGESPTIAAFIRNFVLKHPKYNKDSIVTPEIGSDLVAAMIAISDYKKTYEDFM